MYSVDDAFAYGSLKSHPFTAFVVVKDIKENNHRVKIRVLLILLLVHKYYTTFFFSCLNIKFFLLMHLLILKKK